MNDELATYTFLPWLRQGIANQISGQSGNRATIPIELVIEGQSVDGDGVQSIAVAKDIEIYGPGDITGLDPKSIVKVEPRNWITNFEPNYLPYIDFYDEDLPWRYSPDKPVGHRLKPWLALVVLKESEFSDGKNIKDKPLAFITLKHDAKLQDASQLWAWAHVHADKDLIEGDFKRDENNNDIAKALTKLLVKNPDLAHSRIVCPRKLEEKEAYHAFLVPAFESGRLAGLGLDPSGVADAPAWDASGITDGFQLPFYHRWYFRTGTVGDFEYLVRLLEPKPVDSRVGKRDMDVQHPGANLKGIDATDELKGVLKLGGALRVPKLFYTDEEFKEVQSHDYWAFKNDLTADQITALSTDTQPRNIENLHPFQQNIVAFINLTDSYETDDALAVNMSSGVIQEAEAVDPETEYEILKNPDPLITAPLYGRWHAMAQRLLKERDNTDISPNYNWTHELNLDARWRVSAGFGTKVVQENQENYMKSAWDQVGEILEANKKIRQAQLAKAVSGIFYEFHLSPVKEKKAGKWLSITSPVHSRILSQGLTVYYQKKESKLTLATTSVNMRKLLRPRGKLVKRLALDDDVNLDNLVSRINDGEVSAAPPQETPEGIVTTDDIAEAAKPSNIPDFLIYWLERYPWIKWIPLVLAFIIIIFMLLFAVTAALLAAGTAAVAGLVYLYRLLDNWCKQIESANALLEENQTPESVDDLPNSPDFQVTIPGENFIPTIGGTVDSEEATRFKEALIDVNGMIQESARLGKVKERPALNMALVNETVFASIHPSITIPRWVLGSVILPPFILGQLKEHFIEAMAYPKFDLPMYKPLAEYSSELFLPNINFIEQNSISILETNQKFIEAYMLGLNHEFARELLWREYPTDQRGSYFRQFWDVNGFLDTNPLDKAPILARFKAILDQRIVVDLQEYYDRLNDPDEVIDNDYLLEAHQALLKEELKDIKPIHYWSKFSSLGEHDNRDDSEDDKQEVVLVIRGELLKKYPTAVIYAHKAVWQDENNEPVVDDTRTIDPTKERTLMPIAYSGDHEHRFWPS